MLAAWWEVFFSAQLGVLTDSLPWALSPSATEYIQELLAVPVTAIPFDSSAEDGEDEAREYIEVLEMTAALQSDERATSAHLVVPPGTREAWKALFADIAAKQLATAGISDQRYLVIGSPGVGKSRSINYLLRHIIVERRKDNTRPLPVIVFEHRKDKAVWLFAPTQQHQAEYKAFSVDSSEFHANKTAVLHTPDNFYVIDSGLAEEAANPTNVRAVTVYVCSPDERHFSEYRKHTQQGGVFFIPWWRPEAVTAAHPYMLANPSQVPLQCALDRMQVVGPIPRRVYCTVDEYEEYKRKIDKAMRNEQVDIADVLVNGAAGIDADKQKDKPLSAVFAIDVAAGSNYKTRTVRFVSQYARMQVGLGTLKHVYDSIVSNVDPRKNVELGTTFESVVYRVLHSGWTSTMKALSDDKATVELVVRAGVGPVQMVQAGPGLWQRGCEAMTQMPLIELTNSMPLFIGANFPVIDAADARNRGFSVTIARTKTIKPSTLQLLRARLGLAADEALHVVLLVPENYNAPQLAAAPLQTVGVRWYVAQLPSPLAHPEVWAKALGSH